jgi:hypothetical protein
LALIFVGLIVAWLNDLLPNPLSKEPLPAPDVSILGAMPIHLWEKVETPDANFVNHRIGMIAKLDNQGSVATTVDVAIVKGCVPIEAFIAQDMLIEGQELPDPLVLDEAYAQIQLSTIQGIRASGTIREDSQQIPPLGVQYVGFVFTLPPGRSGAILGVPQSVMLHGDCDSISNPSTQPAIQQLLDIGPIHTSFPRDLSPEFRDGGLVVELHIGGTVLEIDPDTIAELQSIRWVNWPSLNLGQMYEVPDASYPPTLPKDDGGAASGGT